MQGLRLGGEIFLLLARREALEVLVLLEASPVP